ncbi:3',5'-cyclic adenosine monophosphate phosphodiesterase CpdA [Pseudoruegeria aquimaris]|uniref:3',5'-cyclic adenosine monophosphate phosphodiesterase CpdA n=1 Tax=Pseudoruegeria aquimaris TaxID=393663 RepID=A0A1Y5RKR9_9RHOB|nr:phosphodiesterase [Pseudoruegeria aquimaris]SLN19508.1 3',5'-cyclic adenosine monophosphate phosphodiesterase CpdA [Pseudoruegeria aquimaris]
MKLLQMTDIHLTAPDQTIGGRDPWQNFNAALDHALANHPDAEAIFITGDLSDWGETDDYRRLAERIEALPLPVHLCIGNHDDRETFLGTFPEAADENGHVQKVVPLSLGHAVLLDTWGPESHAGHFCRDRARWLADRLAELPGPVWLFLHHNPVPTGIGPMDEIMLLDADRLADAIARHKGKIAHIFHGHCHIPLSGHFRGIPFSAPRGTNHAGWPNFGAERLLAASDLPQSYGVILVAPEGTMVHMIEFGYQGEIREEGSPHYADWDRATMVR